MPAAATAPRSVLILTAESPELTGAAIVRQGLVSMLRKDGAEPLTIDEETIDRTRFASAQYDRNLAALYSAKYGGAPPALVITIAEPALDFALRHRKELFPNAPILFGGTDERTIRTRVLGANVTGVHVNFGALATVETALRLHPDTRNVVVVGGASSSDRAWLTVVRRDLRVLESKVAVTYLTALPFDEMLAEVAALRDHTLVLFVTMTLDGGGLPRVAPEVVEALRKETKVPIYGISSAYLGRGIVGGVMVDLERHGRDLGRRALQILAGASPPDLPQIATPNRTVFDWRELNRFGLDESTLTAGAALMNRELSLWAAYKKTILAVCMVLVGQSLLIGALVFQSRTRRRAEVALRDLSGRLLSAQEDERRRIARELHDNLSQQMALLAIEIEQLAGESPARMARAVRRLSERAAGISTEIHVLSHRLHSSKLEALGLVSALRGHCQELVAQGLQAHFVHENVPRSLPPDVQLCLFRIVQEGLTNVVKHSGVREADVTLTATDGALMVTITDAGRGFEASGVANRAGLGLAGMRERLRTLGGELTIRARVGQGTTIHARVPLTNPVGKSASADRVRVA